MPSHISDSLIYRNSWGTDETRAIFDDVPRTRAWLEILAALAETQAEVGLIPAEDAGKVARACRETPPGRSGLEVALHRRGRRGWPEPSAGSS